MDSRHFADYLAYVKIYDDAVIARMKVGGKPPLVHPESTAAELTARAVALGINKGKTHTRNWLWGWVGWKEMR